MKNTLCFKFEANFDIENIHAHLIPQQLRHRLRTVRCSGNKKLHWTSNAIGMVKPVYEYQAFPLTATAV